jgi:hypothetical protein
MSLGPTKTTIELSLSSQNPLTVNNATYISPIVESWAQRAKISLLAPWSQLQLCWREGDLQLLDQQMLLQQEPPCPSRLLIAPIHHSLAQHAPKHLEIGTELLLHEPLNHAFLP